MRRKLAYGGTGKSGKTYHYYACNNYKRRKCKKKVISKEKIEDRVVLECCKLLTDRNIEKIAASVASACEADYDSSAIKRIKAAIQEADTAVENLWKALERGQTVDMITGRIEKRKREKDELQGQLAIEMGKQITFTAPQIKAFLYSLKRGNINDENNRRGLINIFLRAIYLFDDRFTLILNGGDRQITIDDILLDDIEEYFDGVMSSCAECSPLVADAPPLEMSAAAVTVPLGRDRCCRHFALSGHCADSCVFRRTGGRRLRPWRGKRIEFLMHSWGVTQEQTIGQRRRAI